MKTFINILAKGINQYLLAGLIYVRNNSTLTIEPGTIVKVIASSLCLAGGGIVGREGPNLQLSAALFYQVGKIWPKAFEKVNLQLGKDAKALMVPTQAVIPQARGKQVILLRKDSAQFVNVETGIRDSAYVQITNGLQEGDTVITSGLMSIRPNAKIKVARVNHYQ